MNKKPTEEFGIRYEKSEIQYATQFLISPGKEEVLIDFSSGLLSEGKDKNVLPIQTRLALPWSTICRLSEILNKVVASGVQVEGNHKRPAAAAKSPVVPKATLPQMEVTQATGG